MPKDVRDSNESSSMMARLGFHLWIVPSCNSNNDINEHAETSLKVVGLAIAQEISDHQD